MSYRFSYIFFVCCPFLTSLIHRQKRINIIFVEERRKIIVKSKQEKRFPLPLDKYFIFSLPNYCSIKNYTYLCTRNHKGAIAQLVEQRTENPCVPGSIPGGTTPPFIRAVLFESALFCSDHIQLFTKTGVSRKTQLHPSPLMHIIS